MDYFESLKIAILSEDFYATEEILEKISDENNSFEYIAKLLNLMEENPEIDFGMPGPATHFMEKIYKNGYEELLLSSIRQNPTCQTLFMLNRVINDPNLKNKLQYLNALREISARNDISEIIRAEAKEYYDFQMDNSEN